MSYKEIGIKYGLNATPETPIQNQPINRSVTADPYQSILNRYVNPPNEAGTPQRIAQIQSETQRDLGVAQQEPGIFQSIKNTITGLPSALGQVFSQPFTHPIKTAESVVGGALDIGPTIANSLASLVGIKGRLPKTGEMLNDYLGNNSDVQKAISSATKTVAGYELGGQLLKGAGVLAEAKGIGTGAESALKILTPATRVAVSQAPKLTKFGQVIGGGVTSRVLGNIFGGQLISEAQTSTERAKQATFDAAFGLGTELGTKLIGKGISALKGAPEVKIGTEPPGPPGPPGPPPPGNPSIIYKVKDNLGVDPNGEKVLARTQVDAKTGNALVFYDKSLDANPNLKGQVLDHEFGHIVDKRMNAGTNLSAELPNYAGNKTNLDNVLGDFAKSKGQDVQAISGELSQDIKALSGGKGNAAENFADAVSQYRQNPEGAKNIAPTFHDFMEYKPVTKSTPRLTENVVTKTTLTKPIETPKTPQISPKIAPELQPLAQEARKYGSAEEFVKAQTPNHITVYHRTDSPIENFGKGGIFSKENANEFFVSNKKIGQAEGYGKNVIELRVKKSDLSINDEFPSGEKHYTLNTAKVANYLKTKSQLTDFYNQAVGGVKEIPKPTTKQGLISKTGLKTGKFVETPSFNPKSINAPDEVTNLFDTMGKESQNFKTQRISKGNEAIVDLARLTGLTEDQLIKAKPGSIANSETVTAARQLVLDKAQDLLNELKATDISTATPEQLKAVKDKFLTLISMQKSVAGFRTEASNVFRSLGIELAPGENATMKELIDTLKNTDGFKNEDLSAFAQDSAKQMQLTTTQKVGQGLLSTWYASILSGPKTTVRNILSTSSNILTELASKMANPKQWNEVIPSISGLLKGLGQGFGEAKAVLGGAEATSKFMATGQMKAPIFTGKWATYGKVVESVGRFLNAQDKFLSAGAREMERATLAVRNPELSQAVADSISKAYSESTVYHGIPKGKFFSSARNALQVLRQQFPGSKVIIPFVDTVANVLDRQFDYIPIFSALRLSESNITRQVTQIAKDFNITTVADKAVLFQRLRDQQVGRLFLGSLISTGATALAFQGKISGNGPTNVAERQQLEHSGWRPNSFKIGDVWIPYTFLGPLGGIFSIAGNIYDKTHYDQAPTKTVSDLMIRGLVGWGQTQLSQSFLSGVANVLDALSGTTDPKKFLINFGAGFAPIPALYSQTKDLIFRQQYETHGIIDKLRLKLGLTGDVFGANPLEPRLDAFGEPMQYDLIYGITPSKETKDRVDNFLISNDLVVAKPFASTRYSIPGTKEKRQMTPQEYTKYIKESGQEIYKTINDRIDGLQGLPDDQKKKQIDKLVGDIRDRIKNQILVK